MSEARIGFGLRAAVLAVGLLLPAGIGRADDKPAEKAGDDRAELLKLNSYTGDDAMQAKLTEMIKDKDRSRQLVVVAADMARDAKGKAPPFNYNACLILAKTAHNLKQNDAAELFYERCAEDAVKLMSGKKIALAYEGMIELYQDMKRFNLVEEVCQKFMDLKGGKELDAAKPFILEKLIQSKAKQGQIDEALRMTDGLIQLDEGGWYFVQLKGVGAARGRQVRRRRRHLQGAARQARQGQAQGRRPAVAAPGQRPLRPQRRLRRAGQDRHGGRAAPDARQEAPGQRHVQERPRLHLGRPRPEAGRVREAHPRRPGRRQEAPREAEGGRPSWTR